MKWYEHIIRLPLYLMIVAAIALIMSFPYFVIKELGWGGVLLIVFLIWLFVAIVYDTEKV